MADGDRISAAAASADALKLGSVALPHNLDFEQSLLGAILLDNEVLNQFQVNLLPEHFYEPIHGRIYRAILILIEKSRAADPKLLYEYFARDAALQEIGGAPYLVQLADRACLSTTAPEYARLIYDLSLRRDLIRIAGQIADRAAQASLEKTARDQIEDAEKSLFSLAELGATTGGFQPFSVAVKEAIEAASAAYKRDGGLSGLSSGFSSIDQVLGGLHPSDLLIVAGRPSMGKTAFATNIAYQVARKWDAANPRSEFAGEGGVVAFFSLEMSKAQLAMRILADRAEVSGDRLRRGAMTAQEFGALKTAAAELAACPLHIDDTGGISIGQLSARARRLKRTHGLHLIVVDYLQLVTTGGNNPDNRVQQVSEVTQGLKALAKDLNVPVIALSQLSRQVESREDKRPQLSDLRESGSIEQDADAVMFVYREQYYLERAMPPEPQMGSEAHLKWQERYATPLMEARNKAEIILGKNRHGPVVPVTLGFHPDFTRFFDIDTLARYEGTTH